MSNFQDREHKTWTDANSTGQISIQDGPSQPTQ